MTLTQKEEQLLQRLPEQWRNLLRLFFNKFLPHDKMVSMAAMMSHRQAAQDTLSWDELLTLLSRQEPTIDLKGNLCFQHFLWCFPDHFIKVFLKFLFRQHHSVSADSLDRFINSVLNSEQKSLKAHTMQKELMLCLVARGHNSAVSENGQDRDSGLEETVLIKQTGVDSDNADVMCSNQTRTATSLCADDCDAGVLVQNANGGSDSVRSVHRKNTAVNIPTEHRTTCTNSGSAFERSPSLLAEACTNKLSGNFSTGLNFTEISQVKMTFDSPPSASSSLHPVKSDEKKKHCKFELAADCEVLSTEAVMDNNTNSGEGENFLTDAEGGLVLETKGESQLQKAQSKENETATLPAAPEGAPDRETNGLDFVEQQDQAQKLREALLSGDASESPDMDVLLAIPSSQMFSLCEKAGLKHVGEASLPVLVERLSVMSSKLTMSSSTSIIDSVVKPKYMDLKVPPSRQVMACLNHLATAFPHQLATVLCDCLQESPCTSVQADMVASLLRSLDSSTLVFFLRTLCSSDMQLDENLIIILQSALSHHPDLNPNLLDCVLRLLESGAGPLARNAKYGRLVLNLIKSYKSQLTANHTPVLQNIVSVHTSVIRKSLHSILQTCL